MAEGQVRVSNVGFRFFRPGTAVAGYEGRASLRLLAMALLLRRIPLLLSFPLLAGLPIACGSEPAESDSGSGGSASGDDFGTPVDDGLGGQGGAGSQPFCSSVETISCGAQELKASTVAINVLLVIDKSGSMDAPPDLDTDVTLWQSMNDALGDALGSASDAVAFGLELYPRKDVGAIALDCGEECCTMPSAEEILVPVAGGVDNRQLILTQMGRVAPGGGTPTAAALERAYEYYETGAGKDLDGDRFVLLATDGGPNCDDSLSCEISECTLNIDGQCPRDDVNCCAANAAGCLDESGPLAQIEALRELGVDTFVIGLTGSEQYADQLNSFAVAGGRPVAGKSEKYYRVDAKGSTAGLTQVFEDITTQLIKSCDVEVPADTNPTLLNVLVDCEVIGGAEGPPVSGSAGSAGAAGGPGQAASSWWFDDTGKKPVVRLEGVICDQIQAQGAERIDLITGCPTTITK
jgi:hypothetical protein